MVGETEAHESRTGAQAVERAIAIISCFDSDVPDLGLGEIAERTSLRVSTAHRIVRALVRGGLLAQDPRTERYHLGPRLALLGQSAMARYGLDVVRPQLEDLARVTGEAASLGVRDGDDVVVVLRAESTQPLRFDRPHGSRVPLHASAMGKALLAFAGPEPKATVADLGGLSRYTPRTLVRRSDLVADLVTTRERGIFGQPRGAPRRRVRRGRARARCRRHRPGQRRHPRSEPPLRRPAAVGAG